MQAKFRRLMGIKGDGNAAPGQEAPQAQSEQLMADLEKEFERSRAFQLSRGAGGKSGIGLGYSGTWRSLDNCPCCRIYWNRTIYCVLVMN